MFASQLLADRKQLFGVAHGVKEIGLKLQEYRIVVVRAKQLFQLAQGGRELAEMKEQPRIVEAGERKIRRQLRAALQQRDCLSEASEAHHDVRQKPQRISVLRMFGDVLAEVLFGAFGRLVAK